MRLADLKCFVEVCKAVRPPTHGSGSWISIPQVLDGWETYYLDNTFTTLFFYHNPTGASQWHPPSDDVSATGGT